MEVETKVALVMLREIKNKKHKKRKVNKKEIKTKEEGKGQERTTEHFFLYHLRLFGYNYSAYFSRC